MDSIVKLQYHGSISTFSSSSMDYVKSYLLLQQYKIEKYIEL